MEKAPRVVLVTRPSDYQLLLARHGTRGQTEFFLERRGQTLAEAQAQHQQLTGALDRVRRVIPPEWRSALVNRGDLDRFLFEPQDLVVAVGQDGLVANLAKYLSGQLVVGINPAAERFPGVLVRHAPDTAAELLAAAARRRVLVEHRTMVQACLDDGQELVCLNEVFVGHASHQSARYLIRAAEYEEHQSSSGVIVTTGTGATGWARSIHLATGSRMALPDPEDRALAYFVREPWPSAATGSGIREGTLGSDGTLTIVSEMDERGVIFGDGIEHDCLPFSYGEQVTIRPAPGTLNLVVG